MKPRLMALLACPECRGAPLELSVLARDGNEVLEGLLDCSACRRRYPIIAAVPRLLPDDLIGALSRYHLDFFRRYDLPPPVPHPDDDVGRTLRFYSYARAKLFTPTVEPWLREYWQRSLSLRLPNLGDLNGKLVLDAGCGEGRYTYCLGERGAEAVGMDLSEAVEAAFQRSASSPRCHIVQASIYRPPFQPEVFDAIASTGVLHHLPEPEAGFAALLPHLGRGGAIHMWVYGLNRMNLVYRISHLAPIRTLTRQLSPRASYTVSVPIGLALYLLVFRQVAALSRRPWAQARLHPQLRELANLPLSMQIAEIQDRIGVPVTHFIDAAELHGWFQRAGLVDVSVTATVGGRGWSASGSRHQHAATA